MIALAGLFANNLLPILAVAAIGFLLQRFQPIDTRTLSRLVLYVCVPALTFDLIADTQIALADIARMVAFAATVTGLMAIASFLLGKALRLDALSLSGLVLASAFMNSGNYGLSLNRLALGEQGLAWASLFYVTSSALINSLGIYVARAGREGAGQALAGVLRVPSIYAISLALLVRVQGWSLPLPVARPIEILAAAAIPLMLLQLGMQLAHLTRPKRWAPVASAVGLRLLASPALACALTPGFGLTGIARQAGILEAAMPTALLSSVIATEFDVDVSLVGGAILFSTLLSPFTLTPLLSLLTG